MRINELPLVMLECLAWTILIEGVAALIIGIRQKKDLINVMLVNILTNPIVVSVSVAVNIFYGIKARHISLVFLEIFAVLTEARIYQKYLKFKRINPYLLALILNACSYFIGILINMVK